MNYFNRFYSKHNSSKIVTVEKLLSFTGKIKYQIVCTSRHRTIHTDYYSNLIWRTVSR